MYSLAVRAGNGNVILYSSTSLCRGVCGCDAGGRVQPEGAGSACLWVRGAQRSEPGTGPDTGTAGGLLGQGRTRDRAGLLGRGLTQAQGQLLGRGLTQNRAELLGLGLPQYRAGLLGRGLSHTPRGTQRPFCSPPCCAGRAGGAPWRPRCRSRGRQGARRRTPAAMSELAREELSALAAIYCEPGACEVLAASGEAAALSAPSPARQSPGRKRSGAAQAGAQPLAGVACGVSLPRRVTALPASLGARGPAGLARFQSGTSPCPAGPGGERGQRSEWAGCALG